jgi:hypothetical protein
VRVLPHATALTERTKEGSTMNRPAYISTQESAQAAQDALAAEAAKRPDQAPDTIDQKLQAVLLNSVLARQESDQTGDAETLIRRRNTLADVRVLHDDDVVLNVDSVEAYEQMCLKLRERVRKIPPGIYDLAVTNNPGSNFPVQLRGYQMTLSRPMLQIVVSGNHADVQGMGSYTGVVQLAERMEREQYRKEQAVRYAEEQAAERARELADARERQHYATHGPELFAQMQAQIDELRAQLAERAS